MSGGDLITAGLSALPAGITGVASDEISPRADEEACDDHYFDPFGELGITKNSAGQSGYWSMSKTRRKAILSKWAPSGGIIVFSDSYYLGWWRVFTSNKADLATVAQLYITDQCETRQGYQDGERLWWADKISSFHKSDVNNTTGRVVWIYSDPNYRGYQLKVGKGEYEQPNIANWQGWNDIMSSLKFVAP